MALTVSGFFDDAKDYPASAAQAIRLPRARMRPPHLDTLLKAQYATGMNSDTSVTARAILLTVAAILCFSLMDATVKAATPTTGTLTALWARYTGQMVIVAILIAPRLRQVARSAYPGLQIARSLLLMAATFFLFMALGQIELAAATAVMATNPILITLGGALFLGEALGVRRIAAIAGAMIGALIVIRPGTDVFQPAALLPLVAAFCFAGYTLITRRLGPREDVWTSLFYTGLVGAVVLSGLMPFVMPALDARDIGLLGLICCLGTAGQLMLVRALSMAEAGLLAPFNYSGLIFAVIIGLTLFGEVPDAMTLLGMLVIAAAGIYVWHRETHAR